jgi:hypothetical protein
MDAQKYNITAMPTFVLVRRSQELERIRGADIQAIRTSLDKYYKETSAFEGEGYSMLKSQATTSISEVNRVDLEKIARERFDHANEGQTLTTIRLRLPDVVTPVNIRLTTDRTLNDIRQLLCETMPSLQRIPFEFMEPPAMKIVHDDEKKTINELKLFNAVLNVKKIL